MCHQVGNEFFWSIAKTKQKECSSAGFPPQAAEMVDAGMTTATVGSLPDRKYSSASGGGKEGEEGSK